MNTISTLAVWTQILSIAAGMIVILVSVLRHSRESGDSLGKRRNTGLLIYGLSAILSAFYMINRDTPMYTLGDLAAWVFVFLILSVLLWLVSVPLVMRLLEKTS